MKSLGYCVLPNSVDKFQPALNQCYYMLLVIMCCTDLYLRRILRGLGTYLCLLFFPKNIFFSISLSCIETDHNLVNSTCWRSFSAFPRKALYLRSPKLPGVSMRKRKRAGWLPCASKQRGGRVGGSGFDLWQVSCVMTFKSRLWLCFFLCI